MTIANALSQLESSLASRRVPRSWAVSFPTAGDAETLGDLIALIRHHSDPASDLAIRGLLELHSSSDPDPRTVVLVALAPRALRWRRRPRCDLDEVISELSGVICDPGSIDTLDRLYFRLISRANKRVDRLLAPGPCERYGTQPPEGSAQRTTGPDEVADQAIDRVALASFRDAVADAIGAGIMSASVWDHFVQSTLAGAVTQPNPRRYNTGHARRRLAPIVERSLAA